MSHEGAPPVTASEPGTDTSTTSPGARRAWAITEAMETHLAWRFVAGPRTKRTGVVRARVTSPAALTVMVDTWLEKYVKGAANK